jgi:glycosyltransferase involved in cell wall biosynthesis
VFYLMTRRWGINGRFVTQPFSGVQRYAYEILAQLDALIAERHPLADGLAAELIVPPGAARLPDLRAIPVRVAGKGGGHLWEQVFLPRAVRGRLLNLGNTGPVALTQQIVCLHDANTRVFPASYSLAFRTLYRGLFPALGRRARIVTTVSNHSADTLVEYGIARRDKLRVIPNGHEHALRWQPRHSERTRTVAGRGTILLLGSPAPHKNVGMLLGLADSLQSQGLRIAVVGSRDARVFQAGTVTGADAPNVIWLGRLSDDEIAALLQDCLCLAFPSLVEGFGLPAVEAMARGCPVVSSDAASLPEVCGEAALFASPTDPAAWLAQLTRLARDEPLRAELVRRGHEQVKAFSWRHSAELYLAAMRDLDTRAT